jgi:hypothetical protein
MITYNDGEPCSHPGCKFHIFHPCEVCGRIGAMGTAEVYELKQTEVKDE